MDRITHIRIKNVRAIEYLDLEVSRPLTVLIGENGAGKSTIIECLEILRKASEPNFMENLYAAHRGMTGLLRSGAPGLELGIVIEDDGGQAPALLYTFGLQRQGAGAVVHSERLVVDAVGSGGEHGPALVRSSQGVQVLLESGQLGSSFNIGADQLAIGLKRTPFVGGPFERVWDALRGIDVHLGFDTLAEWAGMSIRRPNPLRGYSLLRPARRLSLLGHNLASAWHELKNRDSTHWERTLATVRLGLGQLIDTVNVALDAGGGQGALSLKFKGMRDAIPASDLSDGQLAWLAFVALARLDEGRTLLAVDEPELHLHPYLLTGVVTLLKDVGVPVILATHSDRVLELLDEPAAAVRVCALEEGPRATFARVDATELPKWLAHFGDFGRLREAGYLPLVLEAADALVDPEEGE